MVILTAILSFVSTNVDDFFVLMLLFSQAQGTRDYLRILLGQYSGIGMLLLISIAAATGIQSFSETVLRLLGLIPLFLGIRSVFKVENSADTVTGKISIVSVAALTLAGGGDNLGIYIPMLTQLELRQLSLLLCVYFFMIPLWSLTACYASHLPPVAHILKKYQRIFVPVVFICLGLMILLGLG